MRGPGKQAIDGPDQGHLVEKVEESAHKGPASSIFRLADQAPSTSPSSMVNGVKALMYSTGLLSEEETTEPPNLNSG